MKDALDYANTFKVVQKRNETLPIESLVDVNVCHAEKCRKLVFICFFLLKTFYDCVFHIFF